MVKKSAFFVVVLLFVGFVAGCGGGAMLIKPVDGKDELAETVISKDPGWFVSDKIAVIEVDGIISNQQNSGFLSSGENPVSLLAEKLEMAKNDSNVKAIVLRINSPGGTVAGSDMMYHSLMEFKKETGKPVVACMLDLAASGGYYLAVGADGIMATPSTITGSIGTIMQTVSFAGTMKLIGIKAESIKSGEMKDMASPFHDMKEKEREVLQGIIMEFYENFLAVVKKGRKNLPIEKLRELADGRVYTGTEARKLGLVDRIGYPDDAVKWAREMAGVKKGKVVIYNRSFEYKANLYGTASAMAGFKGASLINIELPSWLQMKGPSFLYLWQPGGRE